MSSSSTALHNPRAVWFLGAPVSKAIAVTTAIVYVVAEMNKWHASMVLGERPAVDFARCLYYLFHLFTVAVNINQTPPRYSTMRNSTEYSCAI